MEDDGGYDEIAGDLDDDDDYGSHTKTWAANLSSSAGPYIFTYQGEDWAGDNFDFDLQFDLLQVA